jgi:uncharacterized protein (TIGR02391 family)
VPFLHPAVIRVAQARFESGHFADAAEAALKEFNNFVRTVVRKATGDEFDGADLMNRAFSLKNAVIRLDDITTVSGQNIQLGYMQIAAGAMTGIRNPKAHANVDISSSRAVHFLFVASLLFSKLDEAGYHAV